MKFVFIFCIFFLSCSPLQYPIVTRYREHTPKVKYEMVKVNKIKKPVHINPLLRDFIGWVVISTSAGLIMLK